MESELLIFSIWHGEAYLPIEKFKCSRSYPLKHAGGKNSFNIICVFLLSMMTFRQKDLILKSLKSTGRRKVINAYCDNLGKSWLDLDFDEASELIDKLVKLSWN